LRLTTIIVFLGIILQTQAQVLGGNTVFNFLNLPNTPQLTGLGGINISQPTNDVGMSFNNPALLKPSMHTQLNTVFNSFYSGINAYDLSFGYHNKKLNTNFAWGLQYFNYGNIQETDASGNVYGTLRPTDWVMQVSASRSYLQKWNYGATVKFINSNYGIYRSNAVAMDVGVLFDDTAALFSASIVTKNAGFQLKKYAGTSQEDLPFDLQAGISKRLQHAPFSFSLTAYHLNIFDTRYNDTTFNNANGFNQGTTNSKFTFDKFFRHIILATTVYIGDKIEVNAAYNHLRRQELNINKAGNGMNGFSLGVGVLLKKMQIRYARAYYQNNTAYNQFGLNLTLNQYFGLGKFGEKVGW
jgi:hypothetical protein